jgi:hypothetical protein
VEEEEDVGGSIVVGSCWGRGWSVVLGGVVLLLLRG